MLVVHNATVAEINPIVPESFAITACNGFAQLGARGVSVMFSSGDGGVGDGTFYVLFYRTLCPRY